MSSIFLFLHVVFAAVKCPMGQDAYCWHNSCCSFEANGQTASYACPQAAQGWWKDHCDYPKYCTKNSDCGNAQECKKTKVAGPNGGFCRDEEKSSSEPSESSSESSSASHNSDGHSSESHSSDGDTTTTTTQTTTTQTTTTTSTRTTTQTTTTQSTPRIRPTTPNPIFMSTTPWHPKKCTTDADCTNGEVCMYDAFGGTCGHKEGHQADCQKCVTNPSACDGADYEYYAARCGFFKCKCWACAATLGEDCPQQCVGKCLEDPGAIIPIIGVFSPKRNLSLIDVHV